MVKGEERIIRIMLKVEEEVIEEEKMKKKKLVIVRIKQKKLKLMSVYLKILMGSRKQKKMEYL